MNEVNRTLYIPLYGKAAVSRRGIILHDPKAEKIWDEEGFPVKGKSRSRWLALNMAMRARIFDDWTASMLIEHSDALVVCVGCGLDSRCERVRAPYSHWVDCDFPDVLSLRSKYYEVSDHYCMMPLDASDPEQVGHLPAADTAIVVLEGISMYLTHVQMNGFLGALSERYAHLHILMDVYTEFGAKASRFKNPVNDVGVTTLYGTDDIGKLLSGLPVRLKAEHSLTPPELVDELRTGEKTMFRLLFTGPVYRKIYRLYELEK